MTLHSFIHSPVESGRYLPPASVFRSHSQGVLQSQTDSPEIFISEAMSTSDEWEGVTMFSIDGFPYMLRFG